MEQTFTLSLPENLQPLSWLEIKKRLETEFFAPFAEFVSANQLGTVQYKFDLTFPIVEYWGFEQPYSDKNHDLVLGQLHPNGLCDVKYWRTTPPPTYHQVPDFKEIWWEEWFTWTSFCRNMVEFFQKQAELKGKLQGCLEHLKDAAALLQQEGEDNV